MNLVRNFFVKKFSKKKLCEKRKKDYASRNLGGRECFRNPE